MLEKASTLHTAVYTLSIVTAEYYDQETKTLLVKFQEMEVHCTLISVTVCIYVCTPFFWNQIKVS